MSGVGLIVPNPRTHDLDPSVRAIVEGCDKNVVNTLELPVMWSVALESMTQLEEEDIRHVSGLLDSASAVVGVEAGFNNLAYSSVKSTTDCSKVPLADTT